MNAGRSAARNVVLTRIFVGGLGCIAVVWGLVTLPIFWRQSALERTAQSIIGGVAYKPEALAGVLPVIEEMEKARFCDPTALRSAAIIRLRIAELSHSANAQEQFDKQIDAAAESIRESLSCSPADPFLWLALYWLETTEHGYKPQDLKYLRLSYQLGPNEGWIALRRNGITFAMLQSSPDWCDPRVCILSKFSDIAINEFVRLVSSGFYDQAVDVFTGSAWPDRELILPHLAVIAEQDKRRFADVLHRRGFDINVPGVAPTSSSEPPEVPAIASSPVDSVAGSLPSRPLTIP
jgi:hypothetical protein